MMTFQSIQRVDLVLQMTMKLNMKPMMKIMSNSNSFCDTLFIFKKIY
jgi:hypothetical protein